MSIPLGGGYLSHRMKIRSIPVCLFENCKGRASERERKKEGKIVRKKWPNEETEE